MPAIVNSYQLIDCDLPNDLLVSLGEISRLDSRSGSINTTKYHWKTPPGFHQDTLEFDFLGGQINMV